MRYEAIPEFGEGDVERVLARGDLGELRLLAQRRWDFFVKLGAAGK